jgi:hypothetical protein
MAQFALVKMDNTLETGSDGGVVIRLTPLNDMTSEYRKKKMWKEESLPNYQKFIVNDNVREGWIYASKRNVFIDSNK